MPAVVDCRFASEVVKVALAPARIVTTAMPIIAVATSNSTKVEPRSPRGTSAIGARALHEGLDRQVAATAMDDTFVPLGGTISLGATTAQTASS